MRCEILLPDKISRRGRLILSAMAECAAAAGIECQVTQQYEGNAPWLMSYGLGHVERRVGIEKHKQRGGRVIGWDLGYWDRETKMRLTIDHDHPQHLISSRPASRFQDSNLRLQDHYDPAGPILLVGLGKKSRAAHHIRGLNWELTKLQQIRATYPASRILYRPKKPERLPGCASIDGPIETALRGAALVVCHHSNVAVDACFAGIPVVCEDGAAAALYGNDLGNPKTPSTAERLSFLQNLAWWQWAPTEAIEAWNFIKANCV
jgi:hypothetical protein